MGSGRQPNAVNAELDEAKKSKASKTTLGDGASLKRALDDAACAVIIAEGYDEDHTLSTVKIAAGLFTCVLAGIAQLYPGKYPDNFWLLITCVGLYVATTLALNVALGGTEADLIFMSTAKAGKKHQGKAVCCLASSLPRYSEDYKLTFGRKAGKWSKSMKGSKSIVQLNVTDFFTVDGTLLEDKFKGLVIGALQRFEKKQGKSE